MSRRALIGSGAGLAATAALNTGVAPPAQAAAPGGVDCPLLPSERIGLQLYSVGSTIQEIGFEPVLRELAAIGYKRLEFAGYTDSTGISLERLRELMDELGLVAAGSHVSPSDGAMEQILDDAQMLGIPQVGISLVFPDGPPTVAGWAAQAENFNRYGEAAAKRGMRFYMHNHFEEWLPCVDDPMRRGMDVLLSETDPALVDWQCDIYWLHVGQFQSLLTPFDPVEDYLLPQRKRIKLFHFKDGKPSDPPILGVTDVGQGSVDFQGMFTRLFAESKNERDRYLYMWERDNADSHPRGQLASARASYVYMRHGLVAGECRAPRPLRATVKQVSMRAGRARVRLKLNAPAKVTATLSQGGKRLARRSRSLGRGNRTLTLPRTRATGSAKLTVTVTDVAGTRLTLRDTVDL